MRREREGGVNLRKKQSMDSKMDVSKLSYAQLENSRTSVQQNENQFQNRPMPSPTNPFGAYGFDIPHQDRTILKLVTDVPEFSARKTFTFDQFNKFENPLFQNYKSIASPTKPQDSPPKLIPGFSLKQESGMDFTHETKTTKTTKTKQKSAHTTDNNIKSNFIGSDFESVKNMKFYFTQNNVSNVIKKWEAVLTKRRTLANSE